jgi:hypothetical protein
MGGYIPPRLAKKQKRQRQLEQEAAAAAKAGMNPGSQVFIPGLTLIQQPNNGLVPQ